MFFFFDKRVVINCIILLCFFNSNVNHFKTLSVYCLCSYKGNFTCFMTCQASIKSQWHAISRKVIMSCYDGI